MEKITEITLAWGLFQQGVQEQRLPAFLECHQQAEKQTRPSRQVRLTTRVFILSGLAAVRPAAAQFVTFGPAQTITGVTDASTSGSRVAAYVSSFTRL